MRRKTTTKILPSEATLQKRQRKTLLLIKLNKILTLREKRRKRMKSKSLSKKHKSGPSSLRTLS